MATTKVIIGDSLFVKTKESEFTTLIVHVDNVTLAGNSLYEFQAIKEALHQAFKIKYLGILKYFPGLEVAHSKLCISLYQNKYCIDLLVYSGLLGFKPVFIHLILPSNYAMTILIHMKISHPIECLLMTSQQVYR